MLYIIINILNNEKHLSIFLYDYLKKRTDAIVSLRPAIS